MAYLSKFGALSYNFSTTNKPDIYVVPDLMTRVTMNVANGRTVKILFNPYIIQDGDKPEIISYNLYGTTDHHWTILYLNNITNMQTDWPMNNIQFASYMQLKYPDETAHTIKYWRTEGGLIGDEDYLRAYFPTKAPIPVTYYDWEMEENEKKRQILVVDSQYINAWITNFMSKLG